MCVISQPKRSKTAQSDETLHDKKGSRSMPQLWLCGYRPDMQILPSQIL
jgi:hypothetical protein